MKVSKTERNAACMCVPPKTKPVSRWTGKGEKKLLFPDYASLCTMLLNIDPPTTSGRCASILFAGNNQRIISVAGHHPN